MTIHTTTSFEDRCKAGAKAARTRLMGKPRVVNVINDVKQAAAAKEAARKAALEAWRADPAARDARAKELYEAGALMREIAAELGVSRPTIEKIKARDGWPDRANPTRVARDE